jgi:hypothetical protein
MGCKMRDERRMMYCVRPRDVQAIGKHDVFHNIDGNKTCHLLHETQLVILINTSFSMFCSNVHVFYVVFI